MVRCRCREALFSCSAVDGVTRVAVVLHGSRALYGGSAASFTAGDVHHAG